MLHCKQWRFNRVLGVWALAFVFLCVSNNPAHANRKYASLVIDGQTGVVLHQENAGKYRYPASLTKMMTVYLTFQALERRKLTMGKRLRVSSRAAAQPPSKIRLKRGERITVRDALMASIVKSANDASVVLAEAIAGSEWQFAIMMNRMAKKLGMNHTNFRNATGLHDSRQKTTAYDMARLAVALRRDYGKYYHLFKRSKFFYKGKVYTSHNKVTRKYRGADGLKTGYIRASGYNLVTSAKRGGKTVIGVVMGGRSSKRRDRHMVKLLDSVFYKAAKQQPLGAKRLYTGLTPVPKLKPIPKYNVASAAPVPELKKNRSNYVSQRRDAIRRCSAVNNLKPNGQPKLRVIVGGKVVPIPHLKPDWRAKTASLGLSEQKSGDYDSYLGSISSNYNALRYNNTPKKSK